MHKPNLWGLLFLVSEAMLTRGHMLVPEEPQEDEARGNDDSGVDLLVRARLLCRAANEIALPMLQSVHELRDKLAAKQSDAMLSRPSTRDEDRSEPSRKEARAKAANRRNSRETGKGESKLPQLAPPTLPPLPEKRITKPTSRQVKIKKSDYNQDEATFPLPQINATEEWRKQREAERVRHAQERAKARVFRNTDLKELSKSNQREGDGGEIPSSERVDDIDAEHEASRRRALARIKLRKGQNVVAQTPEPARNEPHEQDEASIKMRDFHHRTLQRLQEAKREAPAKLGTECTTQVQYDPERQVGQTEAEEERKRLEKLRRKETVNRMKKQRQLAEYQQRMERELYEKGLTEFKAKKKAHDLVAKELHSRRVSVDSTVGIAGGHKEPDPNYCIDLEKSTTSDFQRTLIKIEDENTDEDDAEGLRQVDKEVYKDHDEHLANENQEQVLVSIMNEEPIHPQSRKMRSQHKKKPSWKKSPVPILPAECFTHQAVLSPSDSYCHKFRLRPDKTCPTPVSCPTILPRATSTDNERTDQRTSPPEQSVCRQPGGLHAHLATPGEHEVV